MSSASFLSQKWFPPSQLAFYFDSKAWSKGTDLYLGNEVLSAQMRPDGDGWQIQAQIQGSLTEPYLVTAHLRVSDGGNLQAWRSTCSCPVGRMCKHGAALGIHAAMQGLAMTEQLDEGVGQSPERQAQIQQERALQHAEYQVRDWLLRLQAADAPKALGLAVPSHEHFLYGLRLGAAGHRPVFHLTVKRATLKANGEWGKPKKVTSQPYPSDPIWHNCAPGEEGIFDLMKACPATNSFSAYGFQSAVKLQGMASELLLRMCASTERLLWESDKRLQPLDWSDEAVAFAGQWQAVEAEGAQPAGWRLRMQATQAGVVYGLNDPPFYVDPERGICGRLDTQGLSVEQVQLLMQSPVVPERVALKFQQQLMDAMGPLPLPPVIEKMPELRGFKPVGVLQLYAVPPHLRAEQGLFQAELQFAYGDGCSGFWAHHQPRVVVGQGQPGAQARTLVRDLDAELAIWGLLENHGFQLWDANVLGLPGFDGQMQWLDWLENDFAPLREAGLDIRSHEGLDHWLRRADEVHVALRGQGHDDDTSPWFDLSLGMEIDGQRVNILPWVPEILKALARAGASALQLDDAQTERLPDHLYLPDLQGAAYVKLPTARIKPWLTTLMELHDERGHRWDADSLRLSRLDALRTAASLGEGAVWQGAHSLQALVQQMRGAASLTEVPPPEGLQATLRPYQQQGLNWLQFLREHRLAGILADDMGLGKTLQTLAHILTEKQAGRLAQPALIVAPVSLLGNWHREAARFCPGLRVHIHHGLSRHETAQELCAFDVVITAYSLLSRDREMWVQVPWHLLVLDEAQNIKNANTHAAQVVCEIPAVHRLCLSGTPIENHLGELWSQFHFLMPGFLGSQRRFTELFRNPIERQGSTEKMAQLRARVTPFMLRRTKDLVASELPPKVETTMPVPLQGQQADLYETIRLGMEKTVREALSTQGMGKSQITILDALLKLRQVCCDPRLLKLSAASQVKESAKLAQLLDMLPEMVAEGRKILLFSQFTEMLGLIEKALPALGIPWVKLTGQSKKREAIIDQFTSGQVPLFLISLKAGGVGLNLPQADTVIHFDPWWNPAVENQATDRAHRIGQTKSVWVIKLVAQGTIEERMLALQERKAQLASGVYEGAAKRKEPLFDESDLQELLKPLG